MGLIWNSLPTYILRFTLTRVATLSILKFVPFRRIEKSLFKLKEEENSSKNKNKNNYYHKMVFRTILVHWVSRIVDILAKALIYPLNTVESRTATSFIFKNGKPTRKYESKFFLIFFYYIFLFFFNFIFLIFLFLFFLFFYYFLIFFFKDGYDCFNDIYENEGRPGFYKGFWDLAFLAFLETVWSWCFLYPVASVSVNVFCPNKEEEWFIK